MRRKILIVFIAIEILSFILGVIAALRSNSIIIGFFMWFGIFMLLGSLWMMYSIHLWGKKKEKENNEN